MKYQGGDLLRIVTDHIAEYYENPENKRKYMQHRLLVDKTLRKEMVNVKRYYIMRMDGAWEVAIAARMADVKKELEVSRRTYNDILNDREFRHELELGSANPDRCVGAMISVSSGRWERFAVK